jgi:hypothetical protein
MSMSTQHGGGGETRRPSSTKPGGKPKDTPAGKTGSAGTGGGATKKGARPGGQGGKGSPRKPITPVKVNQGRNWGPIVLFGVVGAIALGIVGFGGYQVYTKSMSWEDRAANISGIKNYRKSDPKMLKSDHVKGPVQYSVLPPVGGAHNINWQRCLGDVYPAAIANEHAVHSLEHGAIWITYRPDLPKAQVDELAKKIKGHDFSLMSPFPGLDKAISVQAWGYQLKVDKADDARIDEFIKALREKASMEPGSPCSSGNIITETGTTPRDLEPAQNNMPPAGGTG